MTAIVNGSGVSVAEYTYNAWGKLLTATGTMSATLGAVNPLRYRGYVYDAETGFYYLQSRYYDPGICRFINADEYASTGQGFVGCNMFAYCNNCPSIYNDVIGEIPAYSVLATDSGNGYNPTVYYQSSGQSMSGSVSIEDITISYHITQTNILPAGATPIEIKSQWNSSFIEREFGAVHYNTLSFGGEQIELSVKLSPTKYYYGSYYIMDRTGTIAFVTVSVSNTPSLSEKMALGIGDEYSGIYDAGGFLGGVPVWAGPYSYQIK